MLKLRAHFLHFSSRNGKKKATNVLGSEIALGNVAKRLRSHGILEFLVIYLFKGKDRHEQCKRE